MLGLDDPIVLFAAFVLLVVLAAAVRASWIAITNRRRPARPRFVVGGLLLLLTSVIAWTAGPALVSSTTMKVPWQLADPYPGVSYAQIDPDSSRLRRDFDEAASRATTVIRIQMNQWPAGCADDDGWLAAPVISYTPWSITITMHARFGFDLSDCQGWYDFWGQPIEVQLSQPLDGRRLFDGSGIPTAARPYP